MSDLPLIRTLTAGAQVKAVPLLWDDLTSAGTTRQPRPSIVCVHPHNASVTLRTAAAAAAVAEFRPRVGGVYVFCRAAAGGAWEVLEGPMAAVRGPSGFTIAAPGPVEVGVVVPVQIYGIALGPGDTFAWVQGPVASGPCAAAVAAGDVAVASAPAPQTARVRVGRGTAERCWFAAEPLRVTAPVAKLCYEWRGQWYDLGTVVAAAPSPSPMPAGGGGFWWVWLLLAVAAAAGVVYGLPWYRRCLQQRQRRSKMEHVERERHRQIESDEDTWTHELTLRID